MDLPGNIAMDAPALNFDDLTTLAKNRKAWQESFGLKKLTSRLPTPDPINKVSVTINRPLLANANSNEVIKAWTAIFKPDLSKTEKQKCQTKPKHGGWTDRQRANWARAHYALHHGQPSSTSSPSLPNTATTTTHTTPRWSPGLGRHFSRRPAPMPTTSTQAPCGTLQHSPHQNDRTQLMRNLRQRARKRFAPAAPRITTPSTPTTPTTPLDNSDDRSLWAAPAPVPIYLENESSSDYSLWAVPAPVPSYLTDETTTGEDHDDSLWAAPAPRPIYLSDESSFGPRHDNTPTTTDTTPTPKTRTMWMTPTEPTHRPSPLHPATKYTTPSGPKASTTYHPILGYYRRRQLPNPNTPVFSPNLSPIDTYPNLTLNDTYTSIL